MKPTDEASPVEEVVRFVWTYEAPTVAGWYWYRYGSILDIFKVYQFDIDRWNTVPHKVGVEWAGPIPQPNAAHRADGGQPARRLGT